LLTFAIGAAVAAASMGLLLSLLWRSKAKMHEKRDRIESFDEWQEGKKRDDEELSLRWDAARDMARKATYEQLADLAPLLIGADGEKAEYAFHGLNAARERGWPLLVPLLDDPKAFEFYQSKRTWPAAKSPGDAVYTILGQLIKNDKAMTAVIARGDRAGDTELALMAPILAKTGREDALDIVRKAVGRHPTLSFGPRGFWMHIAEECSPEYRLKLGAILLRHRKTSDSLYAAVAVLGDLVFECMGVDSVDDMPEELLEELVQCGSRVPRQTFEHRLPDLDRALASGAVADLKLAHVLSFDLRSPAVGSEARWVRAQRVEDRHLERFFRAYYRSHSGFDAFLNSVLDSSRSPHHGGRHPLKDLAQALFMDSCAHEDGFYAYFGKRGEEDYESALRGLAAMGALGHRRLAEKARRSIFGRDSIPHFTDEEYDAFIEHRLESLDDEHDLAEEASEAWHRLWREGRGQTFWGYFEREVFRSFQSGIRLEVAAKPAGNSNR
jgi:hypothetical protein